MPGPTIHEPIRIALRGGIGSGKSTVASLMEAKGAVVIEADEIGHDVLEPEGAAFDAVAQRWPAAVVEGRIDRRRLAGIVFSDEAELEALEAVTHPHIRTEIERRVSAAGAAPVVVELPTFAELLGEGWIEVIVDAPQSLRIERVVERGSDEADVRNRVARQPSRLEWIDRADRVLVNDGTLAQLTESVDRLWRDLDGS